MHLTFMNTQFRDIFPQEETEMEIEQPKMMQQL